MTRAVLVLLAGFACSASQRPPTKPCEGDMESDRCAEAMASVQLRLLLTSDYEDAHVAKYVTSVTQRLGRAAGDHRPWKIVILDDDDANAFVSLGSTIYIYRGALAVLRSEAELAGLLAHEMGHLRGAHARERWKDHVRSTPRSVARQLLEHRYERDDEIQADEHAVVLLAKAGYDPDAFVAMLRAVGATDESREDPSSTHPWLPERIARAQAVAAHQRSGGERGEGRFRAGLATLIAGKDPRREAWLVGQAAVVAKLGLAIDLPAGALDPAQPKARTTITTPDGSRIGVIAVNQNMAWLFGAIDPTPTYRIETETIGTDVLVYIVESRDAEARMAALRASKRTARRDELAHIPRPTYVNFDAPRRLWTRPP